MKNIAKTLSQIKVDNPILESTLLIESKIEDRARTVTDYHFCRSQPKVRKNPHVAGLSRKALELLDLDYESVLEDKNTAEYLSGSKLLPNSQVHFFRLSQSVTTIADINLAIGPGN
jgi:hypothetical protein